MTIDLTAFPKLPALWDRLRRGAHIHSGDGADFFELSGRFPEYKAAFALFGYDLIEHPAKFYYIDGRTVDGPRQAGIANALAVSFVLIDIANASGAGFDDWFFPTSGSGRRVSDIDFFKIQQHREVLAAAQIKDIQRVDLALKYMGRLGFLEYSEETIKFLPPFNRIRDICIKVASMPSEDVEALALASREESDSAPVSAEEDESA